MSTSIGAEAARGNLSDRERAIRQVNEEFALAYQAIVVCLAQAKLVKDFRSRWLARELEAHALKQLDRALAAAAEVDGPCADPTVSPDQIGMPDPAQRMLRSDPQIEEADSPSRHPSRLERDLDGGSAMARHVRAILTLTRERRVRVATALSDRRRGSQQGH